MEADRERAQNGEAQIEVTQTARFAGGGKETVTLKKEDATMSAEDQKDLPAAPAVVGITKKLTLNIGNFESVSVSVHLSMPCKPEKDAINTMYDKVNRWVDSRLAQERKSVREASPKSDT